MLAQSQMPDCPVGFLKLKREMCETDDKIGANIERTLGTSYVRYNEFMGSQNGLVSLCGSGPSFSRTYKHLVGDVIACNGAHDYLIERGIIPKFGMFFDAAPFMHEFITPHEDVIYLVASRCHENVFKHLKDNKVIVWHCNGDDCIERKLSEKSIAEPMVNGGSAAVGRAVFLAYSLGYREMHLFGADSSFEDNAHHVGKTLVPETVIEIWHNGHWFNTTAWMAGQVEDFRDSALALKERGTEFTIHGDGLLPSMANVMGFKVIPSIVHGMDENSTT